MLYDKETLLSRYQSRQRFSVLETKQILDEINEEDEELKEVSEWIKEVPADISSLELLKEDYQRLCDQVETVETLGVSDEEISLIFSVFGDLVFTIPLGQYALDDALEYFNFQLKGNEESRFLTNFLTISGVNKGIEISVNLDVTSSQLRFALDMIVRCYSKLGLGGIILDKLFGEYKEVLAKTFSIDVPSYLINKQLPNHVAQYYNVFLPDAFSVKKGSPNYRCVTFNGTKEELKVFFEKVVTPKHIKPKMVVQGGGRGVSYWVIPHAKVKEKAINQMLDSFDEDKRFHRHQGWCKYFIPCQVDAEKEGVYYLHRADHITQQTILDVQSHFTKRVRENNDLEEVSLFHGCKKASMINIARVVYRFADL